MSGATIFQIVLLVLVFLVWAWLLYRTVTLLQSRGRLGEELGRWLRSQEDRKDRNTVLFLTFVLAAMIVMQLALPSG